MACEYASPTYEDYVPEGSFRHTADSVADAILLPAHPPTTHRPIDIGTFEHVTAHLVHAVPVYDAIEEPKPPWMPESVMRACHRAYSVLSPRDADGTFRRLLCSRPTLEADSAVWSEAALVCQEGECPDDIVPEGSFCYVVRHLQPFPVEALLSAEALVCGGDYA